MATPEDRKRESRASDVTEFEELTEEVREEQKEAAERFAEPLEPEDDVDVANECDKARRPSPGSTPCPRP
jgi:hypothetical protein